jgi:hypothetical protein
MQNVGALTTNDGAASLKGGPFQYTPSLYVKVAGSWPILSAYTNGRGFLLSLHFPVRLDAIITQVKSLPLELESHSHGQRNLRILEPPSLLQRSSCSNEAQGVI